MANEGVEVSRQRPVIGAHLAANARIRGEPPSLRVIAATARPAAGRVLVPPGEAGVKDGEHEPAARSEDASNSGDRTIEIIDVGQTMIAGDTVEGLAGERLRGGDSISAARAMFSRTSEMSTPTTRAPQRASSRAIRP